MPGRAWGGRSAARALAAVATTGFFGFVVGLAQIGLLSDATNLPTALSLVVLLCLAAAAPARAARTAPAPVPGAVAPSE